MYNIITFIFICFSIGILEILEVGFNYNFHNILYCLIFIMINSLKIYGDRFYTNSIFMIILMMFGIVNIILLLVINGCLSQPLNNINRFFCKIENRTRSQVNCLLTYNDSGIVTYINGYLKTAHIDNSKNFIPSLFIGIITSIVNITFLGFNGIVSRLIHVLQMISYGLVRYL